MCIKYKWCNTDRIINLFWIFSFLIYVVIFFYSFIDMNKTLNYNNNLYFNTLEYIFFPRAARQAHFNADSGKCKHIFLKKKLNKNRLKIVRFKKW